MAKWKEGETIGYWSGIYREPWLAPKMDADPEGRQYLDFWAGYTAGREFVKEILGEEAASQQEEGTFPFSDRISRLPVGGKS